MEEEEFKALPKTERKRIEAERKAVEDAAIKLKKDQEDIINKIAMVAGIHGNVAIPRSIDNEPFDPTQLEDGTGLDKTAEEIQLVQGEEVKNGLEEGENPMQQPEEKRMKKRSNIIIKTKIK